VTHRGSPVRGAATPDREVEDPSARRAVLFVRGVLSASRLGLYTVAGGIGAALALLPAALSPAPRGRTASVSSPPPGPATEANREPLAG
jgi:hypothetical protein